MALEAVGAQLVTAGLSFAIAKLVKDTDVPSSDLAGCLLGLLPGRSRSEADQIAKTLQAEVRVIPSGQTSLDTSGAEGALLDANELVKAFGLSNDKLATLAIDLPRDKQAHPWSALAAKAASQVVEDGRERIRRDDAHRAFCKRIIEAYYRSVLASEECRQRLLPTLTVAGLGAIRDDVGAIRHDVSDLKQIIRGLGANELESLVATFTEPLCRDLKGAYRDLGKAEERAEQLARELNLTKGALVQFLMDMGVREVAPERYAAKLAEIVARFETLQSEIVPAANDDAEVARLKIEAKAALDAGRLDDADSLLGEIFDAQCRALERGAIEQAATAAQRGDLAMTRLRYRDAAQHFSWAARAVPAGHDDQRLAYLWREANALQLQGEELGDNAALAQAIARWTELLEKYTRERVPLRWATTQNNLGNALATLGERENGTARLEEAVVAYRNALLERTRERVPFDWAMTQSNLGTALARLGERERGKKRIGAAVAAFCEALHEYTRERVPLDWAMTQSNLGNALRTLGERESGSACLLNAIAAHRAALLELTREHLPLQWAMTTMNLGLALRTLGEREPGTKRLSQAVTAYEEALQECTRKRMPLNWAVTQINLGISLATLGEREIGTMRLEQAVAASREALRECTRERVPLQWAMIQHNLSHVQMRIGEREGGTARLLEAVAACQEALSERTRECLPLDWAMTQNSLGNALLALGKRESGNETLEAAVAAYHKATSERTRERVPLDWAMTQNNLGIALHKLGERESGTTRLEEAVAACCAALEERTHDRGPLQWATTKNNLGNALATLGLRQHNADHLREALECLQMARQVFVNDAGQIHRVADFDHRIAAIEAALRARPKSLVY